MSERTALYRLFGAGDELLYIGISKDFGNRWTQHSRRQPWWPEVERQTVEWRSTRAEALRDETAAIKAEKPKYNIADAGWRITEAEELSKRQVALTAYEPGENSGNYMIHTPDIIAPGTYRISFAYDAAAPESVTVTACELLKAGDDVTAMLGAKERPMANTAPHELRHRIGLAEALDAAIAAQHCHD